MYKIIGGDQREYGPATADEVRQWIAEGRLAGFSLVKAESSNDWQPLASFPEFAEALQQRAGAAHSVPPPMPSATSADAVLARPAEFSIGECLSRGGRLLAANFGLVFAAVFLVWMVELVSFFLPVISLLYWLVRGVFYGGLCLVILKRIRGESAGVGDVFSGFNVSFAQLVLVGVITSALSSLGMLFCLLPGIYLTVVWIFSVPLVADRRLDFWPAMELSRKVVNRVWFKVFGLVLLAFLPLVLANLYAQTKITIALMTVARELLGTWPPELPSLIQKLPEIMNRTAKVIFPLVLMTKVVLLVNLPFALCALLYAYEDLFGPRPRRTP